MTNLDAILRPRIADPESFREFMDALDDQAPGIERDIAALRDTPGDRSLVARLFRSLHTVKGDASICRFDLGMAICHPIETLISRCRDDEIAFTPLLAEVLLLALDRLELAVEMLDGGRDTDTLRLPQLVGGLERLATAVPTDIPAHAVAVIESVTGYRPAGAASLVPAIPMVAHKPDPSDDLRFFRELALRYEARSPLFAGRTDRILRLALDTNRLAGAPVDATQLEAAIYMHDVGMMFAPESVWLKVGRLGESDRASLRQHPLHAAGLLERMGGWEAAAQMVAQHHEMPDGGGYPQGLKADAICPGAKILAIVDAFEAVTLKHSERGQTRSLVRAIAEINACDNQFAAEWIGPFNNVIRKLVET